ncbi:hypothetical protein [Streptomyces mirabilis]|uniref:hypothetical protein n=1 Tax=Streptomyces mirabilis TaxID=68239 RepID=UPI0036470031
MTTGVHNHGEAPHLPVEVLEAVDAHLSAYRRQTDLDPGAAALAARLTPTGSPPPAIPPNAPAF